MSSSSSKMTNTKADRKTKRVLEKLKQEWKISVISEPTKHIVICNAGLTTGLTYEEIIEFFQKFGILENVLLLPDKSYSFITFCKVKAATQAYQEVHATLSLKSQHNVLYLAFIDSIPQLQIDPLSIWDQGPSAWPNGLRLVNDFVTENEEKQLLDSFNWENVRDNQPERKNNLKHRKVLHFGYEFCYNDNSIANEMEGNLKISAFPDSWGPILHKALALNLIDELPDQCTVNRYEPGQGIPPHIDTHSCCTDTILSISLCSDVVMNFAPPCSAAGTTYNANMKSGSSIEHPKRYNATVPVILPKRSVLVMSGEARYAYTHGIATRQSDIIPANKATQHESEDNVKGLTLMKRKLRISLTFRKSLPKGSKCACKYPAQCDSQKDKLITINDNIACNLEKLHVHSVYEEIAEHFSETRHKPWPKVLEFIDAFDTVGNILIDVGCGNGKYLGHHKNIIELGCDYSSGLLSICAKKNIQGVRCDCLSLPFRDKVANLCVCIAVIHHLSTEERRRKVIKEIARTLKSGSKSKALIYAWAKEQEKDSIPSSYLKQRPQHVKSTSSSNSINLEDQIPHDNSSDSQFPLVLPVHKNRTNFQHNDLLVPWKTKSRDEVTSCQAHLTAQTSPENEIAENRNQVARVEEPQTFHRFYHVFEEGELEKLVTSVPNLIITNSYYDQGNWCVIFEKL